MGVPIPEDLILGCVRNLGAPDRVKCSKQMFLFIFGLEFMSHLSLILDNSKEV